MKDRVPPGTGLKNTAIILLLQGAISKNFSPKQTNKNFLIINRIQQNNNFDIMSKMSTYSVAQKWHANQLAPSHFMPKEVTVFLTLACYGM